MFVRCLVQIFSLLCVPAIASSEAVDAIVCGLVDDRAACHNSQIDSSEEQESAALKLEMLQRQKNQVILPTAKNWKEGGGEAGSDGGSEAGFEEETAEGGGEAGSNAYEIREPKEGDIKVVGEPATSSSLASIAEATSTSETRRGENVLESVEVNSRNENSEKLSKKDEGNVASLVAKDHNDKMCMLCNKPLAERVDREYKEFRTDCGGLSSSTGPNASILATPVAKLHHVSEDGVAKNGFCQLNFAKSCVDAVANKDYLYWAKSINLVSGSSDNAAWDGRYCRLNGFLETSIVALQHDFQATQTKAAELCNTKYNKYNLENITFMDMMSAARYEDKEAPSLHEAELLAAWNCAMGDLGCDLALCAYSFCEQGSGTGLYNECEGWHPVHGMPAPKNI